MANRTNICSKGPPAQENHPLESYDITGKNCDQVVETLNSIVNREDYQMDAVFNLIISPASSHPQHPQAFRKIFRLSAKPTFNQPGSGILSIWQVCRFIARPYDEEMVKDLEEIYGGDTAAFTRHLNTLFRKNETIAKYPFVTSELYMLLLFEIARRSVRESMNSSPAKKKFDKLPIKEAIQGILALLANKKCGFGDVFLKGGKFHCFSGSPEQREKAAKEIKKVLSPEEEGETGSEIKGSLPKQFKSSL